MTPPPLPEDSVRDAAIYRQLFWAIEFNGLKTLNLKRDDLIAPARDTLAAFRELIIPSPPDADWDLLPSTRREQIALFPSKGQPTAWTPIKSYPTFEASALLTREHDTLSLIIGITKEGVADIADLKQMEKLLAPFERHNDAFLHETRFVAGRVKNRSNAERLAAELVSGQSALIVEDVHLASNQANAWSAYRTRDVANYHVFFYADDAAVEASANTYVNTLFPDAARYLGKVRHQADLVFENQLRDTLSKHETSLAEQNAVYTPSDPAQSESNLSQFAKALHDYRASVAMLQSIRRTIAVNANNLMDLAAAIKASPGSWFAAAARNTRRAEFQIEADLGYHTDRLQQAQDELQTLIVRIELDRAKTDRGGEDRAVLITLVLGFFGVMLAISGLVDNDAVRGLFAITDETNGSKQAVFIIRALATLLGGVAAFAGAITFAGLWPGVVALLGRLAPKS